jgi:hypothetical protein
METFKLGIIEKKNVYIYKNTNRTAFNFILTAAAIDLKRLHDDIVA